MHYKGRLKALSTIHIMKNSLLIIMLYVLFITCILGGAQRTPPADEKCDPMSCLILTVFA